MKSPRIFDAQNHEAALIALSDPARYDYLQEWAKIVTAHEGARGAIVYPVQPPAPDSRRKVSSPQPELEF